MPLRLCYLCGQRRRRSSANCSGPPRGPSAGAPVAVGAAMSGMPSQGVWQRRICFKATFVDPCGVGKHELCRYFRGEEHSFCIMEHRPLYIGFADFHSVKVLQSFCQCGVDPTVVWLDFSLHVAFSEPGASITCMHGL